MFIVIIHMIQLQLHTIKEDTRRAHMKTLFGPLFLSSMAMVHSCLRYSTTIIQIKKLLHIYELFTRSCS